MTTPNLRDFKDTRERVAVLETDLDWATAAALPANTRTGNVIEADANGALTGQAGADGVTVAVGDKVLVKNEVAGLNNGPHVVLAVGGASAKWKMERLYPFNVQGRMRGGLTFSIRKGTANAGLVFMCTNTATITINTTAITFGNAVATVPGAGAILRAQLEADIINGTKIEDDAVDSEHLAAGAIDPEHLAAASVTVPKLELDTLGCADRASDHDDGAATVLIPAVPAGVALAWIAQIECTETLNGSTFLLGTNADDDHFDDGTLLGAGGTSGDKTVFSGKLEPTETLQIEPSVAGTAGAFKATVTAVPVTPT